MPELAARQHRRPSWRFGGRLLPVATFSPVSIPILGRDCDFDRSSSLNHLGPQAAGERRISAVETRWLGEFLPLFGAFLKRINEDHTVAPGDRSVALLVGLKCELSLGVGNGVGAYPERRNSPSAWPDFFTSFSTL